MAKLVDVEIDQLFGVLGEGAFSNVLWARHRESNNFYALKCVL